jgi:hypothetical protein
MVMKGSFRHPCSRCELKIWVDADVSCVIVSSAYIVSSANNVYCQQYGIAYNTEEMRYGYIDD